MLQFLFRLELVGHVSSVFNVSLLRLELLKHSLFHVSQLELVLHAIGPFNVSQLELATWTCQDC